MLKLGEINSKKKEKKIKVKKSKLLVMQQSTNDDPKLGLTADMQSPPALHSNMELPMFSPGGKLNNLGKSQTTFRRTPLRVRVEDLMTVNENQHTRNDGGEHMSMSSTEDKWGADERVADSEQHKPHLPMDNKIGRSDSLRMSKQLAAASKRFTSLITENS